MGCSEVAIRYFSSMELSSALSLPLPITCGVGQEPPSPFPSCSCTSGDRRSLADAQAAALPACTWTGSEAFRGRRSEQGQDSLGKGAAAVCCLFGLLQKPQWPPASEAGDKPPPRHHIAMTTVSTAKMNPGDREQKGAAEASPGQRGSQLAPSLWGKPHGGGSVGKLVPGGASGCQAVRHGDPAGIEPLTL